MQMNQADTTTGFTTQASESSFNSVWGNEMQREDFLALVAGLRQFNAFEPQMAFVSNAAGYPAEQVQHAAE
jgi:hypothetical protein